MNKPEHTTSEREREIRKFVAEGGMLRNKHCQYLLSLLDAERQRVQEPEQHKPHCNYPEMACICKFAKQPASANWNGNGWPDWPSDLRNVTLDPNILKAARDYYNETPRSEGKLPEWLAYFGETIASHVTASLRAENDDLRVFNESLHNLCRKVWEALEPTGEYEGDMRLVEFAKSVRIAKDSAEWSLGRIPELEQRAEAADELTAKLSKVSADWFNAVSELARVREALQKVEFIASNAGHGPCRSGGIDEEDVCPNTCHCEWAKDILEILRPQVELPEKGEKNG